MVGGIMRMGGERGRLPTGGRGVRRSHFEGRVNGRPRGFKNTVYWPGVGVMEFGQRRVRQQLGVARSAHSGRRNETAQWVATDGDPSTVRGIL